MNKMSTLDYQPYYRRYLPHIQPKEAIFFITYRLDFRFSKALKRNLITAKIKFEDQIIKLTDKEKLRNEIEKFNKQQFDKIDTSLPFMTSQFWLTSPEIAAIIEDSIQHRNNIQYTLYCYCIMPNHVHILIQPLLEKDDNPFALSKIMHGLKGYTSTKCNFVLNRTGSFWFPENYDHYVRNEQEFNNVIDYILQNPVKAGLVQDWQYNWVAAECLEL